MLNYPNHYCFFVYDDDSNFAGIIHPDTIIEYSQSDEGLSYIYEYYYDSSELVGKTFNVRLMVHMACSGQGIHVEG
jgi:hypothetical protein